ncbi:hypothetical protein GF386_06790 [Candidatus Pacearchaeota archaeon]|nr:hypothetical protein [Candidatus Pacearchaeota archaeon]
MKKPKKNRIPIGIKIISAIYFLTSLTSLIISGIAFFKKDLFLSIPPFNNKPPLVPGAFIYLGILMIIIAVLSFLIAFYLLKSKQWAIIAVAVISLINIIGGVLSIIEGSYLSIINLLANTTILGYIIIYKYKLKNQNHPGS